MSTQELIDAQFDRAVEIVQGLPKTGPIQTDYEEKLTMYSLYKQATVGNVKSGRPAMWDMLGRAKWDAWAKHSDLNPYEAKWLYVDALIKVLRKYSDKTVARNLIEELESYRGDAANIVQSQSLSHSPGSDSSSSTVSDADDQQYHSSIHSLRNQHGHVRDVISEGDESETDEARDLPVLIPHEQATMQSVRPPSSLSSQRYRTPLTGSLAVSPKSAPGMQPLPHFESQSAFAEAAPLSSPPAASYAGVSSESSRTRMATPATHYYPAPHSNYRTPLPQQPREYPIRPASRLTLERAVENVQVHLAALTERLESLESLAAPSGSHSATRSGHLASPGRGRGSPHGPREPVWDLDDLGMWSFILNPLAQVLEKFREFSAFFARNDERSPASVVIRRLCLDASFLAFFLIGIKFLWQKSGVRRREVRGALIILGRAILGTTGKHEKTMIEKGI